MRIAIILSHSSPADRKYYNNQEVGLGKALNELGIDVDIFVYSKKRGKEVNVTNVYVNRKGILRVIEYDGFIIPGKQVLSVALVNYMFRHIAEYSIVQVHESTQIMAVGLAFLSHRSRVPCLLCQGVYRDFDVFWKKIIQKIYDVLVMSFFFRNLSCVVGKTETALGYLRSKGMGKHLPVNVIPVGLDFENFCFKYAANRSDSAVPIFDVLYVGKIEKRRNPQFLAGLLHDMYRVKPNFKACVIGDGPLADAFVRNISDLIAVGCVTYIPKEKNQDIGLIFQKSKMLLLPTHYEIFGMVILEAMFFGCPVIASNEAGPREIIQHNTSGLLVDGFVIDTWRSQVLKLLKDEELRLSMGESAHTRVNNDFSWKRLALNYMVVYDSLTRRNEDINNY